MNTVETAPIKSNKQARIILQLIAKLLQNDSVTKPIAQVLNAMKRRVEYEEAQLSDLVEEMERLEDTYQRYREVEETVSDKAELLNSLQVVLDPDQRKDEGRVQPKLWEVLELYLAFAEEAQVADILEFLERTGYQVTRQAIESTVKTHKDAFVVRKDGWDRFISLARKERYAAATKRKRK